MPSSAMRCWRKIRARHGADPAFPGGKLRHLDHAGARRRDPAGCARRPAAGPRNRRSCRTCRAGNRGFDRGALCAGGPRRREAAAHRDGRATPVAGAARHDAVADLGPKLESYLEHHRKFHFAIYAMSGVPLLVETIENMWLRCGPVLSFVIPEYVVLLKGTDRHTAA